MDVSLYKHLEENDSDPFACYGTDSEYNPDYYPSSSDSYTDNSSPHEKKVITTKRKRNTDGWQRIKSKHQKNLGQSYQNVAGYEIPAKSLKSGCSLKCRLKCHDRVPEQIRKNILEFYYKIGNKERQWNFIANSVQVIDKKITKISSRVSRRKSSRLYHLNLPHENNATRVCLKMFLDTLVISNQTVDTALSKTVCGGNDNRGKYVPPVNELKQMTKEHVMRHISSFPTVESHYLRAQTTKLYLDSDLNVAKMHRLYLKWINENNISTQHVTERQYRDMFNFNFTLSFFTPKKDQCNDCTSYANMSASDKEKCKDTINKHQLMKNEARRIKNIDKASAKVHKNIVTCCFDFQKILQCPFGETSIFFYKRKLNLHNFTVYNLASHQGDCFLWDVDICHKFVEKGHTQNEGDSMHSTIEKCRKRKTIYVPAQYYSLIRNAKINGSSYIVHEMELIDILNFKKLSTSNFFGKNTKNETVQINKIREIFVTKEEPNKILYKYEFDEQFQEIILYFDPASTSKRPGRKRKPINRAIVDQLYNEKKPITECKYVDLMYLCKNNYIPGVYKPFYESLPHSILENQDSDE